MNRNSVLTLSACLLAAFFTVDASAAGNKGAKNGKRGDRTEMRQALRKYDRNKNGEIDGQEREALRNGFEAFRGMDTNSDGKLADSEIATLQAPKPHAGKGGKGGKKKRKQTDAATS